MGIVSAAKEAIALVKKIAETDVKIELQQKMLEVQAMALDLQEENTALKARLKATDNAAKLREELVLGHNAYYRKSDPRPIPYCTACFDGKGKLISLADPDMAPGRLICPVCKWQSDNVRPPDDSRGAQQ